MAPSVNEKAMTLRYGLFWGISNSELAIGGNACLLPALRCMMKVKLF